MIINMFFYIPSSLLLMSSRIDLIKQKWVQVYEETPSVFKSRVEENLVEPIPGNLGLLKLINLSRTSNKRKTENETFVIQREQKTFKPFNPDEFNFSKIDEREKLLVIDDAHGILVNVSPMFKYHFLFCPFLNLNLPQKLNANILIEAKKFLDSCVDPQLTLLYNSTGALSSVNHLHFHGLFEDFPILAARFDQVKSAISVTSDWPITAVKFTDYRLFVKFVEKLLSEDIPHNLLIRSNACIVFPRNIQQPVWRDLKVAVVELSGIIVCFNDEDFAEITEVIIGKALNDALAIEKRIITQLIEDMLS
jgi:hypothetical protein